MITGERIARWAEKAREEEGRELEALRGRRDMRPEYEYFLGLLEGGISPEALEKRTGKPVINLLCVQAPLELIHAAGFLPFKLFSGSYAASSLVPALPALM